MTILPSQRDRALALLAERGMLRLSELKATGITAATVKRMEERGAVVRLNRGLYQRPDAPLHGHHGLAEADLYKERNKVERFFSNLKQSSRVATCSKLQGLRQNRRTRNLAQIVKSSPQLSLE